MNSLTILMSIIKSLNENVTDSNTKAFQDQLSQIAHQHKNDPVVTSFVKIMHSLGKYLSNKKNSAHIDALSVLNSISEQLENIIKNPNLEKDEIKQIHSIELVKFNALKSKISSSPSITDKDMNRLKEVILAVDWEISDTTTGNFETIVTNLLSKYKTYKIYHTYLKIIHSIGKYIGRQKADAHTDSISLLHSVFENLEKIIQTPTMSLNDKKNLIEIDITRFQEFKQKISQKKQPVIASTKLKEDENLPAALSHIKQDSKAFANEELSLTMISESEDPEVIEDDSDQMTPALSGKGQTPDRQVDVMDDLFNLKDSPADELLDAIHLMDLNDPEQAQKMLDQTSDISSDGLKNLSPRNIENKPIAEIGNRLDEFFNLEPAPNKIVKEEQILDNSINSVANVESKETIEIEFSGDDDKADGVIPFEYEDESPEPILPADNHISDNPPELNLDEPIDPIKASASAEVLQKLMTSIFASKGLFDKSSLLSINKNITFLEKSFENDTEKSQLLQTLSFVVNLHKNEIEPLTPKKENTISDVKKTGFWEKLKGFFKS